MAKSYTVRGELFKTQKDLVKRVQGIISQNLNKVPLDMFDHFFMLDLLERHPESEQKIGCGVESIHVDDNPIYPGARNRGFYLVRTDGTQTDFSYRECLRPTPHKKKVLSAMRAIIEPDTLAFKNAAFDGVDVIHCPDTGKIITFTTSHVDHVAPLTFPVLVDGFLAERELSFDDVEIQLSSDNQFQDKFVDETLAGDWREYHANNAQLEVVSAWANLSIRKRAA